MMSVRAVQDDELVADVLCEFGKKEPTAPVWVRQSPDGSSCGWCAYGQLHEALMPITDTHLYGPFRDACKLFGNYSLPGQSTSFNRFSPKLVRDNWKSITIAQLREAMGLRVEPVVPTDEWSSAVLMEEIAPVAEFAG